jgi:phosphomannomutase
MWSPTKTLRISTAGVRGLAGRGLEAEHALDFGAAFAGLIDADGPILTARDTRASGRMLVEGVTASLLACGRDVVDLGITSTPVMQHAIRGLHAAGGISIGASHNSAEWNALKFLGPQGNYLGTAEAAELLDIYHLRRFPFVTWDKLGRRSEAPDAVDRYLDNIAAEFDLAALGDVRVLVDCCNGTSGAVLRRLRERSRIDFVLLNEPEESVQFAHEPQTTQKAVERHLAPLVKPTGAAAAFLFDLDSDRVAMADEHGVALSEELLLPMLADFQLQRRRGNVVLANVSSTALLEEVAQRYGGQVHRVAVGRQAAMDALSAHRAEDIALAGEGTGAVMLPQFRFVYDGVAAMLAVLTMMKERGRTLSQLMADYPRYSMLKCEMPLRTRRLPEMLHQLEERFAGERQHRLDGLRVDFVDGPAPVWFHVRVSQTEPVIRIICEQRGEAPRQLFEELREMVGGWQ